VLEIDTRARAQMVSCLIDRSQEVT